MLHDTRGEKPKKYFRVLSCVIYSIIENNVCIYYLACQSKTISEITVGSRHGGKCFNRILGIGIPDLLINLLSCHGFSKSINYDVILKFPKRMLEYYFPKGFAILECNTNNLAKLPNAVKQIIYAEETDNSDYFMTCINTIPSTSNTLKKLLLHKFLHSSYNQTEFTEKWEIRK